MTCHDGFVQRLAAFHAQVGTVRQLFALTQGELYIPSLSFPSRCIEDQRAAGAHLHHEAFGRLDGVGTGGSYQLVSVGHLIISGERSVVELHAADADVVGVGIAHQIEAWQCSILMSDGDAEVGIAGIELACHAEGLGGTVCIKVALCRVEAGDVVGGDFLVVPVGFCFVVNV